MRYPINLASEPFRRDRPIFVASLALSAILGLLLITQIWMIVVQRGQAANLRAEIASLEKQLEGINREHVQISQVLRQPENAEVLDQMLFLNELLYRKGISWTKIFADLETVVPYNVRIVSVRPQVNTLNQIQLDLLVAAQTNEPIIQMYMKLEQSTLFGKTTIATQLPPSQSEPFYRSRLSVTYAQKL